MSRRDDNKRFSDIGNTDSWRIKVDEDISGLSRKMAGVETVLSNVASGMNTLSKKFDNLQSSQLTNNKTQWPAIFAGLGLIALIFGGVFNGYVRDLNRVEFGISKLRDDFNNHHSDGHPEIVISQVKQNRRDIEKQDIRLQMEMRLISEKTESLLEALDHRLQNEMKLLYNLSKAEMRSELDDGIEHELGHHDINN